MRSKTRKRPNPRLTCPVIFKAVEEMEDHHDQSVEGDECNVHLGYKEIKGHNEDPFTIRTNCKHSAIHIGILVICISSALQQQLLLILQAC